MISPDFFTVVPSMPADEVRRFLAEKELENYNLIDVRQPGEYEKGHLPGARLIPLPELNGRLDEIERGKPTIVYCASGRRSRSAAGRLLGEGFQRVYSMEGGIRAWNGMVATGGFEAGMASFAPDAEIGEMVAVAWAMEEGAGQFYRAAGERLQSDTEAAEIFRHLVDAEEHHKRNLLVSYEHLSGRQDDPASRAREMGITGENGIMEGGIPVKEVLAWLENRKLVDVLDLAMGLEINSYDLYLKLSRRVGEETSKRVFAGLAREEQRHLERLGQLLDKRLAGKAATELMV